VFLPLTSYYYYDIVHSHSTKLIYVYVYVAHVWPKWRVIIEDMNFQCMHAIQGDHSPSWQYHLIKGRNFLFRLVKQKVIDRSRMKPFRRSRDHLARICQTNGDLEDDDDDDKSPTSSAVNVIQMFNSDQNPLSPTLTKYLLYTHNVCKHTSDPSLSHLLDN